MPLGAFSPKITARLQDILLAANKSGAARTMNQQG